MTDQRQLESRLIPILREGIDIVKMIFFKKLKTGLSEKYPDREAEYISKLAGSIINELFCTPNSEASYGVFAEENRAIIDKSLQNIATDFEEMRVPLTDALRTAVLCDHQEDTIDNSETLSRARELGVLLIDRDLPLPHRFLELVRKLGAGFGLIVPPVVH